MQSNSRHSSRDRRWCIFTSAGDHHNVLSWLDGAAAPEWDIITAFYGDDDETFKKIRDVSAASFRIKGSKFQNLKKIVSHQPGLFSKYDRIWVADDDLIVSAADITRLFNYADEFDFWICQPAFSDKGRVSHPVTRATGNDSIARIVNFVEVTCPLFQKDMLMDFLSVYDGELVGWGIDWWFCNYFDANRNRKFAVIDDIVVINPHDHQRGGGQREILKLQSDDMRRAKWQETAARLHLSEYAMATLAQISKPAPSANVPGGRSALSEDVIADLRRDLPKKEFKTIFDIGTNAGKSSIEYNKKFPDAEIYSFEPSRTTFDALLKSTNSLTRIHTYCIALSKESGNSSTALEGNSALDQSVHADPSDSAETVERSTIADFCRVNNIEHIDFLKIQMAGRDLDVIIGAEDFLENIDILQCQVSGNPYNRLHVFFDDVWSFLFKKNFYLYKIYDQTKEWTGGGYPVMRRFDCVFINSRIIGPLRNVIDH